MSWHCWCLRQWRIQNGGSFILLAALNHLLLFNLLPLWETWKDGTLQKHTRDKTLLIKPYFRDATALVDLSNYNDIIINRSDSQDMDSKTEVTCLCSSLWLQSQMWAKSGVFNKKDIADEKNSILFIRVGFFCKDYTLDAIPSSPSRRVTLNQPQGAGLWRATIWFLLPPPPTPCLSPKPPISSPPLTHHPRLLSLVWLRVKRATSSPGHH